MHHYKETANPILYQAFYRLGRWFAKSGKPVAVIIRKKHYYYYPQVHKKIESCFLDGVKEQLVSDGYKYGTMELGQAVRKYSIEISQSGGKRSAIIFYKCEEYQKPVMYMAAHEIKASVVYGHEIMGEL